MLKGVKVGDERGKGRFVRVRGGLFIFRPISNYRRYERPRIAAAPTGKEDLQKGVKRHPCVIGIHLWARMSCRSLLSLPVPFSRLSRPVARFLLRFVTRFSLPLPPRPLTSSRGSRGVKTSRPPRIFCVKMCMRTPPSRVKRPPRCPQALRVV